MQDCPVSYNFLTSYVISYYCLVQFLIQLKAQKLRPIEARLFLSVRKFLGILAMFGYRHLARFSILKKTAVWHPDKLTFLKHICSILFVCMLLNNK